MATEVSEAAPAKLNLCLHVTGRRADGYHLLDSLVVFADVGDRVTARLDSALTLRVTGPEGAALQAEPENLVLRAAQAMGIAGAALSLDKHLPVASGIGGGSADAAACLRALGRLTGKPLPSDDAVLRLGADVPVCLTGRPARMSGIGEVLAPLPPLPPLWCVLVNPRQAVPTPAVFRALEHRDNAALPELPLTVLASAAAFAAWLTGQTRNDLVPPARLVAPILADVHLALEQTADCLLARMSGSGGTHFGLFANAANAEAACSDLSARYPDWWIRSGRILT